MQLFEAGVLDPIIVKLTVRKFNDKKTRISNALVVIIINFIIEKIFYLGNKVSNVFQG